jgi:hypothetical protein
MRRGFKVLVSGAALLAVMFAGASTATAQEPAQEAPKPPTFPLPEKCQDCEVALVTVFIKADKAADFETVLNKVKESMAKNEKVDRKPQAAGWTIFKGGAPVRIKDVDTVMYLMRIDPIVKGADYDLMRIIAEVFPVEAQELFKLYRDAFAGRSVTELKRFMPMQ